MSHLPDPETAFKLNRQYEFDRIKSKYLKKKIIGQMKRLRKIQVIIRDINLIAYGFFFYYMIRSLIKGGGWLGFILGILFITLIWWGLYLIQRERRVSKYKRLALIGILSRSLYNHSYKATTTFNTYKSKLRGFEYRVAYAPYSGDKKVYYFNPYVVYDTNLKHENSEIDGVKFKFNSFIKLKTKAGSVVREIITMNFKFYFKMPFIMKKDDYGELEDRLRSKVTLPSYDYFLLIEFPQDNIIRFKLKIILI